MKIIGVLGRPSKDEDNNEVVVIYKGINDCLQSKNCFPLLIMPPLNQKINNQDKIYLQNIVDKCSSIIISGGDKWYQYDKYVVNYAIEKDIPVLGICMGMQLLASIDNNDVEEESLILNNTQINHKQKNSKYVHKITILKNTLLDQIINKKEILVNSKHNYHIKSINNFIISAYSEDGLIEAIELPNKKFVLGIQWHPEIMINYDRYANRLLDYFIKIS